jgi:hypothetical protein
MNFPAGRLATSVPFAAAVDANPGERAPFLLPRKAPR